MSQSTPTRADASRNHETLLAAATRAFASASEPEPSMRAIAREAGVGIGTLYRHFPTKEALVEAIHRDQLNRLTSGAKVLLEDHVPAVALRKWMDIFAEWVATKRGMTETLRSMFATGEISLAHSRAELLKVIANMLEAGAATGELRNDISAEDIAASLIGTLTVAADAEQAKRLLDLLMDAVRTKSK